MTIRVLLDATSLPPRRAGVGHYLLGLIHELSRRPSDVELHVAAKARDLDELRAQGIAAAFHPAAANLRVARLAWEQTLLPRLARGIRADLVHGPHYTVPLWGATPSVMTFHDPTFFTHPELHERSKVVYFTRMARLSARRAARVIAVSEYAARGAIEHTGAHASRVDIVALGVDQDRYSPGPSPADAEMRAARGLTGPYFLWVGTVEPRKDLPTLVRGFESVGPEAADRRLVIAGQQGWKSGATNAAIAGSRLSARILRLGYVSEEEKVALYRGATAFVYPSIAEGFGLPVLEAMACGCAVITTTGSAPQEIGGDAVDLVPPGDPVALAAAMTGMLDDKHREDLRSKGLERASSYSWARTAEGTLETYRRALSR
jgi:glycosyltransferase involved in cell wall biosynthesis